MKPALETGVQLKPALETGVFVERFRALNLEGAFNHPTACIAPPYPALSHQTSMRKSLRLCGRHCGRQSIPPCSGASSETRFKLKALSILLHNQTLKPGAFKPESSLHRPPHLEDGPARLVFAGLSMPIHDGVSMSIHDACVVLVPRRRGASSVRNQFQVERASFSFIWLNFC